MLVKAPLEITLNLDAIKIITEFLCCVSTPGAAVAASSSQLDLDPQKDGEGGGLDQLMAALVNEELRIHVDAHSFHFRVPLSLTRSPLPSSDSAGSTASSSSSASPTPHQHHQHREHWLLINLGRFFVASDYDDFSTDSILPQLCPHLSRVDYPGDNTDFLCRDPVMKSASFFQCVSRLSFL